MEETTTRISSPTDRIQEELRQNHESLESDIHDIDIRTQDILHELNTLYKNVSDSQDTLDKIHHNSGVFNDRMNEVLFFVRKEQEKQEKHKKYREFYKTIGLALIVITVIFFTVAGVISLF